MKILCRLKKSTVDNAKHEQAEYKMLLEEKKVAECMFNEAVTPEQVDIAHHQMAIADLKIDNYIKTTKSVSIL